MCDTIFYFLFTLPILRSHTVSAFYTPIYFQEDEVRHVRSVTSEKPPCEEGKLIEFLAERQVSSPESIIGIAISDFGGTCSATTSSLKKVDNFLKNCTAQQGIYLSLLNGLRTFDEKLCKNNDFYKKYEKFDKCYTDLDKDYDSCDGAPDWYESDQQRTCRIYKKIIDCYYIKTAKVCGIRAAKTLKELMVEVMDCSLTVRCSAGANPKVKDAMPDTYSDSLENVGSNGTKVSPIFIFVVLLYWNKHIT